MKKKYFKFFLVVFICISCPSTVLAHPGRTDGNGCHTCRTNCPQWGLAYGEYHCHNNGSSSSSSHSGSNGYSIPVQTPKSSDNTLKLVRVNGINIPVSDGMSYETYEERVSIVAETNDSKAIYETNNRNLNIGDNNIEIKVTAENGSTRSYNILVYRKKKSNNTNIRIYINGNIVNFIGNKANLDLESSEQKIDYKYELEDENATVLVDEINNLKSGDNFMTFKVTAHDGTKKNYVVNIRVPSKQVDTDDDFMSTALGLVVMGGIGYAIYSSNKKKRKFK